MVTAALPRPFGCPVALLGRHSNGGITMRLAALGLQPMVTLDEPDALLWVAFSAWYTVSLRLTS